MNNYTDIWLELEFWREHVNNLEDLELIDEIAYLCYDIEEVDNIIYEYYNDFSRGLPKEDRLVLEQFFILINVEDSYGDQ